MLFLSDMSICREKSESNAIKNPSHKIKDRRFKLVNGVFARKKKNTLKIK